MAEETLNSKCIQCFIDGLALDVISIRLDVILKNLLLLLQIQYHWI